MRGEDVKRVRDDAYVELFELLMFETFIWGDCILDGNSSRVTTRCICKNYFQRVLYFFINSVSSVDLRCPTHELVKEGASSISMLY